MSPWRRNLAVIWLSQFLSIMGFAFCMPFAPFYIQELGVKDPTALKMWVSAFAAATPLGLALFAPFWGAVADRFGRRIMLLRANFAATVILGLMGVAESAVMLVGLRFLQGALTGTVTASQTLVASSAPVNRSGFALGALSTAVFSGSMVGASMGGLFAERFGYRAAFFMAGGLMLVAAFIILFGTREDFERPSETDGTAAPFFRWGLPKLGTAWPILFLIVAMATARHFDMALFPLLVQDIHGSLEGAALWTGWLFAVGGIAGLSSGLLLGRLADRVSPLRIGKLSALGAAVMMVPQGLAQGFLLLFPMRAGMLFFAGGLDPIFQIWLAKTTPSHRRGFIFGWAATARASGWVIAPLLSGLVAAGFGVRSIYFVGGVLFLLLIPLITVVAGRTGIDGDGTSKEHGDGAGSCTTLRRDKAYR